MVVHHDERIRACRRVNCPGHDHENHRQYHRRNGNPKPITKHLVTGYADQGTPKMTPEQCAGLRRFGICQRKQKDRRPSQGEQEEGGSAIAHEPESKSDSDRGADGRPYDFKGIQSIVVNHFHPVGKPVVFSVSLILFYKNTTRHPPGKTEVWKGSGDRALWDGEEKDARWRAIPHIVGVSGW